MLLFLTLKDEVRTKFFSSIEKRCHKSSKWPLKMLKTIRNDIYFMFVFCVATKNPRRKGSLQFRVMK